MSGNYFKDFPVVAYKFGNNEKAVRFQQLNAYVDVVEQVKDDLSMYMDYTILDGDRPDQLSYKLYGDMKYYWTFFLMNDDLREQGWPLSSHEVSERVPKYYPHQFVTTNDNWFKGEFKVGAIATGKTTGAGGKIIQTIPTTGTIIIESSTQSKRDELVEAGLGILAETVIAKKTGYQYDAVHHYEDANGKYIDINPLTLDLFNIPSSYTPVTFYERFIKQNDKLKEIKVLKPETVQQVQTAFDLAMRS